MPTYKPELTPSEQAKYLSIAMEQKAAGTKVNIPHEWQEKARFLRVTIAGSPESLITQISPTIVLYAFRVRLLAERGVTLQAFEVGTSWDADISACYPEGRTPYRFASGLEFNVKEVLNDRIEHDLRFRRGEVRAGWLLAMGNKPVPEEYGPGRPAPLEVRLFDQFGQSQVDQTTLLVERSARILASSVRPGAGLYEPVDPNVIVPGLFTQDPSWVARRKMPIDELLKYRREEPESESDSEASALLEKANYQLSRR
jgi:hypothetical protein